MLAQLGCAIALKDASVEAAATAGRAHDRKELKSQLTKFIPVDVVNFGCYKSTCVMLIMASHVVFVIAFIAIKHTCSKALCHEEGERIVWP